jgi:hypothetical protein
MSPAYRTACSPHQLATMIEYADSGIKDILAMAEKMLAKSENLPDELEPINKILTDVTIQLLIEAYAAHLMRISETHIRKVPGRKYHRHPRLNQTRRKRSRSNGI